ncbi:MAG TPA: hypothetical protein VLF63_03555 [Patescibacteria group bacterium]|nr:hypothetical protein [Patescibacteria group bacterium]
MSIPEYTYFDWRSKESYKNLMPEQFDPEDLKRQYTKLFNVIWSMSIGLVDSEDYKYKLNWKSKSYSIVESKDVGYLAINLSEIDGDDAALADELDIFDEYEKQTHPISKRELRIGSINSADDDFVGKIQKIRLGLDGRIPPEDEKLLGTYYLVANDFFDTLHSALSSRERSEHIS